MDCGLNSKESRDSFTKVRGRTGTRDSRPSDLDLVDQIKVAYDQIWAAASELAAQGEKGCGRRRDSPAARSRGGARPEKVFWGLQGSAWAGVWPWRMLVARVVHLGCGLGLGRSGARSSAAMAALDGQASPEQAVR